MPSLESGQSLGVGFTLIDPLGRGAMGEVWLVRDERTGERVVAKLVPPQASDEAVALLERECRLLRKLDHPGIVRVFGFHRGDRGAFLTMAHVDGDDIGQLRGAPPAQIIDRLLVVAEALEYAHSLGVVHRDVKVSNVCCDRDGRPYLLDFGIAGVTEAEGLRLIGGGSRHSMSPQQLAGEPPQPADDIYAFGVLLYELLTGHPPPGPNAPLVSVPGLPASLQSLLRSLLARKPADRPRSMSAVAEALRAVRSELEPRLSPPPPAPKKSKSAIRLTPPPRAAPVKTIAPLDRAEPHSVRQRLAQRTTRRLPRTTIVGLAALLLAAATVFVYLPRWAQERQGQASRPEPGRAETPPVTVQPLQPEQQAAEAGDERWRAQEALTRASHEREALEARGAERWGDTEWRAATARLKEGEERLQALDYGGALQAGNTAAEQLEALKAKAPAVLRQTLEDGQRALSAGDGQAATEAFALAKLLDPGSQATARGLERARVADRVAALVDSGRERERSGALRDAARDYQQAATLDPHSTAARDALARVRSRVTRQSFAGALSEALSAIERDDYAGARAALDRADALAPEASEVAEARARLEQRERLRGIAEHRAQALALEAREEWPAAAEQHAAVLALDPTIAFAQDGHARCLARAKLDKQLAFHIDNPERLTTDAVHAEASALLERAAEIDPAGPRLTAQRLSLRRLLDVALTPVAVVLESDELTEVRLYKVGPLGTFRRRTLELRPGRYAVVGSRAGYRDVRHELVVVAGETPAPLVVRCEDLI